jgi:hypothetical protein
MAQLPRPFVPLVELLRQLFNVLLHEEAEHRGTAPFFAENNQFCIEFKLIEITHGLTIRS